MLKFKNHFNLIGEHAVLSASKSSWVNYDEAKMAEAFTRWQAAQLGTRLHDLAKEHILLRLRMSRSEATLNRYINDAIGFNMTPEQVLYYSQNAFGTADAISFDERKSFLRIHDLKTGVTKVNPRQLEVYAALFCLEYGYRPGEIDSELRIYQNDEVLVHTPSAENIGVIMSKIVAFDKLIERIRQDG